MALLFDGLKGEIISILTRKYPLQVQELGDLIEKVYQHSVSKQAIHKSLKDLLGRGIILKHYRSYQLDPKFITTLENEVAAIKAAYFGRPTLTFDVPKNGKREYKVNSLLQADSLWNDIITEKMHFYKKKEYDYLQQVPHAWFSLSNTEAEIQVTNTITERCTGFYTLVNGNSPLDRWIERFYKVKNSYYACKSCPSEKDKNYQFAVIGSFVLENHYPEDLADRLGAMFLGVEDLSQLHLQELIGIVKEPVELTVTLTNRGSKASRLADKIRKEF